MNRIAWMSALAVAAWALAGHTVADEIDEILELEGVTHQAEAPASYQSPTVVAEPAPADVTQLTVRLHTVEAALSAARIEIAQLQEALVSQQQLHDLAMQRSHYNMGCVYKAARQFERAEIEFLLALEGNPEDLGAHYNLGILYEDDLEQPAKARKHYQIFLELAPDDEDAATVQEWLATMDK